VARGAWDSRFDEIGARNVTRLQREPRLARTYKSAGSIKDKLHKLPELVPFWQRSGQEYPL
jgi:hypothetical protein